MLIEFAYAQTVEGIEYKADESADLERDIACPLINQGLALKANPVEATVVEAVTPEARKPRTRSPKKES